jgi:hypothetical protein
MYIRKLNTIKNTVISRLDFVVMFFILPIYCVLLFSVAMSFSSQYVLGEMMISKNFLIYESAAYGFKIQYPSGWEKTEFSGGIEEGHRKIIVNFVSPLEGASDTFREYLIIEIGMLGSQAALSFQYAINRNLASLKSLPNFKLI